MSDMSETNSSINFFLPFSLNPFLQLPLKEKLQESLPLIRVVLLNVRVIPFEAGEMLRRSGGSLANRIELQEILPLKGNFTNGKYIAVYASNMTQIGFNFDFKWCHLKR